MLPLLPIVVYTTAVLVTLGSAVYASDQQNKREEDRKRHRAEIEALEKCLAREERKYRELLRRFGEKNRQVRELAEEVDRLREELASLRLGRLREELTNHSWRNSP